MQVEAEDSPVVVLIVDDERHYAEALKDVLCHEVAADMGCRVFVEILDHPSKIEPSLTNGLDPDAVVLDVDFTETGGTGNEGATAGLPYLLRSRAAMDRPRLGVPIYLVSGRDLDWLNSQGFLNEKAPLLGATFHKKNARELGSFARMVLEAALAASRGFAE